MFNAANTAAFAQIEPLILGAGGTDVDARPLITGVSVRRVNGDNQLHGGSGNDTPIGGNAADRFAAYGYFGKDSFGGAAGIGDLGLYGPPSAVTLTFTNATDGVVTDRTNSVVFVNVEAFEIGSHNDVIDFLNAGSGVNLFGNGGDHSVIGSNFDDSIFDFDSTRGLTADGGLGNDCIQGGVGSEILDGGKGEDYLNGTSGAGDDDLGGDGGKDVVYGETGSDTVRGGTDVDTMYGGSDADRLFGGGGSDQILTFPNGETIAIPVGTVGTLTQQTQFASLVAMGVLPCFAPGVLIMTTRGEAPVERLCIGDMIVTAGHGPQPLRWIGKRTETVEMRDDKHLPVQIKAGALGTGLHHRLLIVSPLHRIVLSGRNVHQTFGEPEVLAHANALTGDARIRRKRGNAQYDEFSLWFDRHEIIIAERIGTESYRPRSVAMAGFEPMFARRSMRSTRGCATTRMAAPGRWLDPSLGGRNRKLRSQFRAAR